MRSLLVALLLPALAGAQPAANAAPEPAVPAPFMDQFLSWDRSAHVATRGRARLPLGRDELFEALGRPDLVEKSHAASRRRVVLSVSAGVVLLAGLVARVVIGGTAPDLNSPYCVSSVRVYNEECIPRASRAEAYGVAATAGGMLGASALATLAYWSDPMILSDDEAERLISDYNAATLRQLRRGSPISLAPKLDVAGLGLSARWAF